MRLVDAAEPTFARHETFHPRYGWFRKSYVFAALDPLVFGRDDAPVVIGVGKNMVRAIRFWGLAAKVVVEDPTPVNPRSPGVVPTRIGHALFGEDGWDEYMEDPGTLWLLHWLLLAPPSRMPVWWLAFNEMHALEFTDEELLRAVEAQLDAAPGWAKPNAQSVRKDVSALVRTYAPAEKVGRHGFDDVIDCPLRELQLIGRAPATGKHRFNLGPKPTLPPEIVAYACMDFVARMVPGGNTITVSRLAQEAGAPGRVLQLSEAHLVACLQPVVEAIDSLALISPTGATQLSWTISPDAVAVEVLSRYFGRALDDVVCGPIGDAPISDDLLNELGAGRDPNDVLRPLLVGSLGGGP